jgi:hypothetical protein
VQKTIHDTIEFKPELVFLSSKYGKKGGIFSLTNIPIGKSITIGRSPNCDVSRPTSSALSKIHYKIVRVETKRFVLEDCDSTNGTFINGLQAHESNIDAGDIIGSGDIEILFNDGNPLNTKNKAVIDWTTESFNAEDMDSLNPFNNGDSAIDKIKKKKTDLTVKVILFTLVIIACLVGGSLLALLIGLGIL